MNPGYAGRSNLPDNLKQLFRAVAMVVPDRRQIAQVMLYAQGIATGDELSGKIVLLFTLCQEQLSQQSHYDFGLRSIKSVLVGAGELKRDALAERRKEDESEEIVQADLEEIEREVLIRSTCNTVVPKLVKEDLVLFESLLSAVFAGCDVAGMKDPVLRKEIEKVCEEHHLEPGPEFVNKVLQLKEVLLLRHGVMMVGPSGSGKSAAWQVLLKALERVDQIKGEAHTIDPKAITKDQLYGVLDPTTLEWTDGVFTSVLREILNNKRGESPRRHWIIFDGDVDPEWAENLNSVLDDNKLLTLPSGERLEIPSNMRIMLEVDTLKYATLATVSRCGMVWFSSDTISHQMLFKNRLSQLEREPLTSFDAVDKASAATAEVPEAQKKFVELIKPFFLSKRESAQQQGELPLVEIALEYCLTKMIQVMDITRGRLVQTLFSLLGRGAAMVLEYDEAHPDFNMSYEHMDKFATKWLLFSMLWGFSGAATWEQREKFADMLLTQSGISTPDGLSILELQVQVSDGEFVPWSYSVPKIELEAHRVIASDAIVTTNDTVRHTEVLRAWLEAHKPLILCGPPGSGKTMTLTSTLQSMPHLVLAPLNFSSTSTPDLILKTFSQYCEYARTARGTVLQPAQSLGVDKWVVIFCDEINLPEQDVYGTQSVIMFLRQLTEQGGFWRNDNTWVTLHRIQFVGACNPPTDAGRVPLSHRFLCHAPVLLVDYPAELSLKQIYGTFIGAMLKLHPSLKGYTENLTSAMIDCYLKNQAKFTPDMAPQYIYSPRELSRWTRALYEAIAPLEIVTVDDLVRLWAHEGLRLFHDRLILPEDKIWAEKLIDDVADEHFRMVDTSKCLAKPLLYSCWLSKHYLPVDRNVLREFMSARLKVFYEEELDVKLVIFDEVLDHVLRLDSILRLPMGHLLLVGESGAGKTVLSKFVSWMNGLSIFQIKTSSKYTSEQFDDDLRTVMKRVGVNGEKVCFIFDESNVLSAAFLERMNALLASGEVPGLFEGEEYTALMNGCREVATRESLIIDSEEELFRRFTQTVQKNLHVVFTMNPASGDYSNRCVTSPALYNRCVVDWFGTWSTCALAQVGFEFTSHLDLGPSETEYKIGSADALTLLEAVEGIVDVGSASPTLRQAVVSALVHMHSSVKRLIERMARATPGRRHFLSPRDYLDLIRQFVAVINEKRSQLEEQQLHINVGLDKLVETQKNVAELQASLEEKDAQLQAADHAANSKLKQMVAKQNEAEQRKAEAEKLSSELEIQNAKIEAQRSTAEKELSEAEPALLAARESVSSIKKGQLDEVRMMGRPPALVKLTLEAVVNMLGEKTTDWDNIRKVMRGENFIGTVVNFSASNLTEKRIEQIKKTYLENTEFEYEAVNRASKACGPLYRWLVSQVKYCEISTKLIPLREEVARLTEDSEKLGGQRDEAVKEVEQLESAIAQYKAEYAEAIREMEQVKAEKESVTTRVERAEALLQSLAQERDRWEKTSQGFQIQMGSLVGDGLMAAGFLTYAGIFDHRNRRVLLAEWKEMLDALGVPYRAELGLVEYLSRAADRLEWQSQHLPSDDLCMENAIILERFNRFPLVVDPSGQAEKFLIERYKDRKIVVTSFLDSAFMKTLASAIRFGTPLLVQDVETVDPILNPVLNKELHRTGGRTLIRLGNEEVDFSPKFMIVLMTRDPATQFTPDLLSRVTFVNFTVTPASLQAQALSNILKAERPDVDARRTEVLRLQGEQNVKLRGLEDKLLETLSSVQGNILDDDSVVKVLETLKTEASQVTSEAEKTAEVMATVEATSQLYEPLALSCSRVYFCLQKLASVHFLYQFSIHSFLRLVAFVLQQGGQDHSITEAGARVKMLQKMLFGEVARRSGRSLLNEDKLLFACRLAQIFLQQEGGDAEADDTEFAFLTRSAMFAGSNLTEAEQRLVNAIPSFTLSDVQAKELLALSVVPKCARLIEDITANNETWAQWLSFKEPELAVPSSWIPENLPKQRTAFLSALVIKALRPDRVMASLEAYVSAVLGEDFPWRAPFNLAAIKSESQATSPILLCSEPGYDASGKVDALADGCKMELRSVAMGSAEGFELADKMISAATKEGGWVLLRNIHLCPEWLTVLEKRLHTLHPHPDFRLFLTSEINPRLPTPLLTVSDIIVVDAPTGIKAHVERFLQAVPPERMLQPPAERNRLYLLLAWLHATVLERLRYAPIGWTKRFEFNEADAFCALDSIDDWVKSVTGTKAHIDPANIPWTALRTLLSESIYGGRIDNAFDQALMQSFVDHLFSPKSFDDNFPLVAPAGEDMDALVTMRDKMLTREDILQWISSLPNSNPPTWLGLSPTAETHLVTTIGRRVVAKLARSQDLFDGMLETAAESEAILQTRTPRGREQSSTQEHLKSLFSTVNNWLNVLPQKIDTDRAATVLKEATSHALERCLAREVLACSALLKIVREDLSSLAALSSAPVKKLTNALRTLITTLTQGDTPANWRAAYIVPADLPAEAWIQDFSFRIKELGEHLKKMETGSVGQASGWCERDYWLGGFFNPEGFMTATRQFVAHANNWSLEELVLMLYVGDQSTQGLATNSTFSVKGLVMEGAEVDGNTIKLSNDVRSNLSVVQFCWVRQEKLSNCITLPVYLHAGRSIMVCEVGLQRPHNISEIALRQRAVALLTCDNAL